jgi:O-antigen ligase
MQQLFSNRWFALAEFISVLIISALIVMQPRWGSWLVILILLPWLSRLIFGLLTFERTVLVIPIALFIITAVIGVWAAYDQQAAINKLWVILGAFAVFASLVSQPKANLGVVASLVGLLGVIIAIIFLLTNDWQSQSSDLDLIKRAGDWIMAIRPPVDQVFLTPNFAGGLLAILVPIPFAISIHFWHKKDVIKSILAVGMVIVILWGLFLTSSRGAWIALLGGAAMWMLWRFSLYLAAKTNKPPLIIFGLLLLITILPLIWIISILPGGIVAITERIPGLPTGGSRYDLAVNTSKLIGDYPFTGGGLRSFPGQYSQYILVIPHFLFAYSHNFYLDVTFEQGIVGGLAIFGVIIGAAWMLMANVRPFSKISITSLLSGAVITSTFVLLLHGLVDDALYGDLGSPLLLLIPGFAVLMIKENQQIFEEDQEQASSKPGNNIGGLVAKVRSPVILFFILLFGIIIFRKPIIASWYANMGAVDMAKWDLAEWPQNQWDANPEVGRLESAQQQFVKAVSLDPNQRTAWHRSGLIAVQAREFDAAQDELTRAFQIDPEHRGIRKSLGYVLAWNGEFAQAALLLEGIGEARDEMEVYTWWWQDNQQPELADRASNLAQILKLESSTP